MHTPRALASAPLRRILAVTAAVIAVTLTTIALTAASSEGPASRPPTVAATSNSAVDTSAPVADMVTGSGDVNPATTDESTSPASSSTAAKPVDIAPQEVSSPAQETPAVPPPNPTSAMATPDARTLVSGEVKHTTEAVNLRDAPGADDRDTIIDIIPGGQQVASGETVDGWVPVHWGENFGWVSASYLAEGPAPVSPAPPADSSGDWMADMVQQVDPNGLAVWVFERNQAWGASDGHKIFIDPDSPADKHFSIMVHEYSHILQAKVYGTLTNSIAALSAIIGGRASDVTANESTADCMALMQGATWVNYGCRDDLRPAAAAILAGNRP